MFRTQSAPKTTSMCTIKTNICAGQRHKLRCHSDKAAKLSSMSLSRIKASQPVIQNYLQINILKIHQKIIKNGTTGSRKCRLGYVESEWVIGDEFEHFTNFFQPMHCPHCHPRRCAWSTWDTVRMPNEPCSLWLWKKVTDWLFDWLINKSHYSPLHGGKRQLEAEARLVCGAQPDGSCTNCRDRRYRTFEYRNPMTVVGTLRIGAGRWLGRRCVQDWRSNLRRWRHAASARENVRRYT